MDKSLLRRRSKKLAPAPRVTVEGRRATVVADPNAPAVIVRPAPGRVAVRREFRPTEIRSPDLGIWFDRAAKDSLLIMDVAPNSAVAKLGFIEGDRILAVNAAKVNNERDFVKLLFAAERRDQPAEVLIIRKNKEQVVVVDPAVLEDEYRLVKHDPMEEFGLVVDDRYDDRIVVWKVVPRSPAFYAGFRPGDVVTTFRGQPVAERKVFVESFTALEPGMVDFEVRRGDRVRPLQVEVPASVNVGSADVERISERREERIENRIERRNDRRN